ncbi:hypothetical protein GCM10010302_25170 [Streptomyces polychromogenes]|uniref:Uncharacterized protein n=1 Tax=Streptomyces polychromogenes TaxID=67342 RepID=A0ABP3EZ36_9ACTN
MSPSALTVGAAQLRRLQAAAKCVELESVASNTLWALERSKVRAYVAHPSADHPEGEAALNVSGAQELAAPGHRTDIPEGADS